jgi:RNA recognition motif-containing protein
MNIYISNLNFKVTSEELEQLFADFGTVTSAKVINDRETGRSRGFGFVEISDDSDAQRAIEELNQAEFQGKTINVTEAKPRTDKPRGSFGGGNDRRSGGGGGYSSDRRGGGNRY